MGVESGVIRYPTMAIKIAIVITPSDIIPIVFFLNLCHASLESDDPEVYIFFEKIMCVKNMKTFASVEFVGKGYGNIS
jgi:hypothetical protein|tara:strand:+ start:573 stop:806 length:234 start_codon:yes stop_codon:yes gene_type:complete